MYPRILRLLPSLLTFVFSLLAFIFCVLAISSREWAVRNAYNRTANTWDWKTPIFTLYRSPFNVCTAEANSTSPTGPIGWNVTCINYRAYGFDQTSCELGIATQSDTVPNYGDERLCQQIHYAGNFGITSVFFITLGFMLTGLLALTSLATVLSRGHRVEQTPSSQTGEAKGTTSATTTAAAAPANSQDNHFHGPPEARPEDTIRNHRQIHRRRSALAPYITLGALVALFVGAITGLICQFYAIEGLIQSNPNNGDFASSGDGSNDDINTKGNHGPWYQGKALSVYVTCAWVFASAAGIMAARAWRLPKWDLVL